MGRNPGFVETSAGIRKRARLLSYMGLKSSEGFYYSVNYYSLLLSSELSSSLLLSRSLEVRHGRQSAIAVHQAQELIPAR